MDRRNIELNLAPRTHIRRRKLLQVEPVQATNPSFSAEIRHLHGLFLQAPSFKCVLHGADHVVEWVNLAFLKLVGGRELVGKTIREGLPGICNREYLGLLDRVFTTGEAFTGRKMRVLLPKRPSEELEEYFLDFVYQPIKDVKDEVIGIFIEGYDVTGHVRAKQRQSLLIRELHHRVRNTLATVQAVMNMTARSSATIDDFQQAFTGRIASLAKTHFALTEELEQSVSFLHLLNQELEPYCEENGRRICLDGPFVKIPSQIAVPLGMAIHELTANATKHGALGHEEGWLKVDWNVVNKNGGSALFCKWREYDGPPVSPPTSDGFGSMLLKRVLSQQIHAKVDVQYNPKGFCLQMVVPLLAESIHI
jgi:two-component sensor histidine kinase